MSRELTIPEILSAFATATPETTAVVHGPVSLDFRELWERSCRVANVFAEAGATLLHERGTLENWESGQGHVALLLRNGPEYLECMLGAFIARGVTFNVNFRYTADELAELFTDSTPVIVVAHDEFATAAREALEAIGSDAALLQVTDDSGVPLLDGARRFEELVGRAAASPPRTDWSPDDLYVLYTGGTTGKPKGVLWRQGDALVASFSVVDRHGNAFESAEAVVEAGRGRRSRRLVLATPPFIHGAAQWMALGAILTGNQVVIQEAVRSLDPAELMATVARDGATEVMLVGDAFGRPIAEAAEQTPFDVPSLRAFVNGGAALSPGVRDRLLRAFPNARVVDNIGSSESGRQATRQFQQTDAAADFQPLDGNVVVSEDHSRVLTTGDEIGWLAKSGRVPLGYLNDPTKTAATFPVIDGTRYAVPGDRATLTHEGVEVLGRDSTTINTGGEKVFSEEVESVLLTHPAVDDVLVIGRASERWGQEVVALVQTSEPVTEEALITHAGSVLARYKLPKQVVFVDAVPRTPAGKADHRAARSLFEDLGDATP